MIYIPLEFRTNAIHAYILYIVINASDSTTLPLLLCYEPISSVFVSSLELRSCRVDSNHLNYSFVEVAKDVSAFVNLYRDIVHIFISFVVHKCCGTLFIWKNITIYLQSIYQVFFSIIIQYKYKGNIEICLPVLAAVLK